MAIEALIAPRTKDLGGGFMVRRLLPSLPRQGIGPFVFFDHFGPVTVRPSDNFDVRPHPHIGLATVTYLFEGAMLHRDNLGVVQRIEPGAINWMTAGRGIVHSERRPEDLAARHYVAHGLQLWAALPRAFEETTPTFAHTAAHELPQWQESGFTLRLLVGELFDRRSPVATFAPTLYLDARAGGDAALELPAYAGERAVYVVEGSVAVDGQAIEPCAMAVLTRDAASVHAQRGARFVVIGGEPLDGPRFIYWNYVSSSRERIERAKEEWRGQRMAKIPGETEWIPLPP
jgi:redox-sensitive bicupin YhaK (pirin superfamily)